MSVLHELERLILGRTAPRAVEAILAAGYRKPRTITTTEELDELPKMSVVRDDFGGVFQRQTKFIWTRQNKDLDYEAYDIELPATVLWEPEATA